jgi:hypothetical protein
MTHWNDIEIIPRSGINLNMLKAKLKPLMTGPCAIPNTPENRELLEFMVTACLIKPSDIIFTQPYDKSLPHNKRFESDADWDNYNAIGTFYWHTCFDGA